MAFSSTLGTEKFNIETGNATNVILSNNVIKSDGPLSDYTNPAAQFYVDKGTDGTNLLYRFRPVSQTTKYLAVVGSSVVLKDVPNTSSLTDSSHDFYVVPGTGDYVKYLYRHSPTNALLYMSRDDNNDVIIARDAGDSKPLFRLRKVDLNTTTSSALTTASAPEYFVKIEEVFEEVSSEGTYSITEFEETSFSGKIIANEKISISEE